MKSVQELKEQFNRDGILLSFNGAFNNSLLEELGNAARAYLKGRETTPSLVTDVFAVYVEQTQNVRNYYINRNLVGTPQDSGIVLICLQDENYVVSSGNYIRTQDAGNLREKLEALKNKDKAELKKMYKEQIRKPSVPGQGAGLGLLEMARRSLGNLEYDFIPAEGDFVFFTLSVTVGALS